MEEKATACSMIYQYAAELKGGFFPYVQKVAEILVPLLKFYFHDGVRRAAVSAMSPLLESAKGHLEATGQDKQSLAALSSHILNNLNEAIQQEVDIEITAHMFEILGEVGSAAVQDSSCPLSDPTYMVTERVSVSTCVAN